MKRRVRYLVRSPDGAELTVPSLPDLVTLYESGFLGDEDLVRQENGQVWERAGAMGALRGVRERRREPKRMGLVLIAIVAAAVALGVMLAR